MCGLDKQCKERVERDRRLQNSDSKILENVTI